MYIFDYYIWKTSQNPLSISNHCWILLIHYRFVCVVFGQFFMGARQPKEQNLHIESWTLQRVSKINIEHCTQCYYHNAVSLLSSLFFLLFHHWMWVGIVFQQWKRQWMRDMCSISGQMRFVEIDGSFTFNSGI